MSKECGCTSCCHPKCPPINLEPSYNEISHEIGDTQISIKVTKDANSQDDCEDPCNINCTDAHYNSCQKGCTKVNVIANEDPPAKAPSEKMIFLKTTRQILTNEDLKSTFELEFKLPRNYVPLPKLDLPLPIIIPKTAGKIKKKKKSKKKGGSKK